MVIHFLGGITSVGVPGGWKIGGGGDTMFHRFLLWCIFGV